MTDDTSDPREVGSGRGGGGKWEGGGRVVGVEEATGMGQQYVDKGTELFHM